MRFKWWLAALALVAHGCGNDDGVDYADKTGPTVVSVSPTPDETDVSVFAEITVTFTEAIAAKNFDVNGLIVTDPQGNRLSGFVAFNNKQLILRRNDPFAFDTVYTVAVTRRVTDLFGNPSKPYEWSFTTRRDTDPPPAPNNLSFPSLTNQPSVTLKGSKESGATITVNGEATPVTLAGTFFSLTLALAVEGENTFTLHAVDAAGNRSKETVIVIELDSTPPEPVATCGAGGAGLAWHQDGREGCWNPPATVYWNKPSLPLGVRWTPQPGEAAFVRMGKATSQLFFEERFTHDPVAARKPTGKVLLEVVTRDMAGNESGGFSREFVYDTVPPALAFSGGAFGVGAGADAVTRDPAGSVTLTKEAGSYFFAESAGAGLPSTCLPADTICSVDFVLPADGKHRFAFGATDAAGNLTLLQRWVTLDRQSPRLFTIPVTDVETGPDPVLHVFTDEPATVEASLTPLATGTPAPLVAEPDPTAAGRHYSFTPGTLSAGDYLLKLSLTDAAGNETIRHVKFAPGAGPTGSIGPGYGGFVTDGTGRGKGLTLTGLPAAALNVVRYRLDGTDATLALAVTTGTEITFEVEPLSVLEGALTSYGSDGVTTGTALDLPDIWQRGAPSRSKEILHSIDDTFAPFPIYGVGMALDASASTVGFFTDRGYLFATGTEPQATNPIDSGCSFDVGPYPPYPVYPIAPPLFLLGRPCEGGEASVVAFDATQPPANYRSDQSAWKIDEAGFARALTAANFFGETLTVAVASPGGNGKVYLYSGLTATAPTTILRGAPFTSNKYGTGAEFGVNLAFARNHRPPHSTLAVVARKEPALYLFDDTIFADWMTDPLAMYHSRHALPPLGTDPLCPPTPDAGRHEVVNAGDIDGDGSQDFVVASWDEQTCSALGGSSTQPLVSPVYVSAFLGGLRAGTGAFTLARTYTRLPLDAYGSGKGGLAERPRLTALGDVDGDGLADFGYVDYHGDGAIRMFYGDPSGMPRERVLKPFADSTPRHWILAGSIDAQGDDGPRELILWMEAPPAARTSLPHRSLLMAWP